MQISRVGDFTLGWGESLLWDDRRDRLYFVDCATQCSALARECDRASCRPSR